ncbi:MAG: 3-phosphoshikimate 1-carboxyvinyltransferase [Turneriella sp.]|nr:3-phosphoshikimate 1-carboxyvinyltransferase [Turneriella sp.]
MRNEKQNTLRGSLTFPGDKSLSHRAALLAALAKGTSTLYNFLGASDTLNALKAIESLGVSVTKIGEDTYQVKSPGVQGLTPPKNVIDCGNSGTLSRLLLGMLAGLDGITATIDGDASLRTRPMRRVTQILEKLGAQFEYLEKADCLPIRVTGTKLPPIVFTETLGSAQVKSAVILAALSSGVSLSLTEEICSRDHTENMLRFAGVLVKKEGITEENSVTAKSSTHGVNPPIFIPEKQSVKPQDYKIWGDISSAAFFAVGASLLKGSEVLLQGVLLNPFRDRYLKVLTQMGASVEILPQRDECGEKGGDVLVRYSPLSGIKIPKEDIPSLIDELPILTVAGVYCKGTFSYRDAKELRVKESDRIGIMVENLENLGVSVEEFDDGLSVEGNPSAQLAGKITTRMDHRIVMSFEIANLSPGASLEIEGKEWIETSFPSFYTKLQRVLNYAPPLLEKGVVAIDGPAGSGKSTVAYMLARALGFNQLDSGALYRAFTYRGYQKFVAMEKQGIAMEKQGWDIAVQENEQLVNYLQSMPVRLEFAPDGRQHVYAEDVELQDELRSAEVASRIKPIADALFIRERVKTILRDAALRYTLVADGRDMGTEVFPEAHFKFFLTASSRVRAERRLIEFQQKDPHATLETVEKQIIERDRDDGLRKVGALKPAPKAIFIDTSSRTQEQVVQIMLAYIRYAAH